MKATDCEILGALEAFGAAFPWDKVDLWLIREPEGTIRYSAILNENSKFGFNFASASGQTARDAVTQIIAQQEGRRDPEAARLKKLAELREQIQRLEAVVLGMPPYRPNSELAEHNPITIPQTIDV